MSSDESDKNDVASKRETRFVPQPDDDEVLWKVVEITAERGNRYKVKWEGVDPATNKPWAQSWVAKHDCTDDLVDEWKAKQKGKRPAAKKNGGGRTGTTSRASSSSKRTESAATVSGKKTRRVASEQETTPSRLDSVERTLSPPPRKLPSNSKRKRWPEEVPATTTITTGGAAVQADKDEEEEEREKESRPRKKQKTALEVMLLPPVSSDEDGENPFLAAWQNWAPSKGDGSDDEKDLPPLKSKAKVKEKKKEKEKEKNKSVRRSDVRPKNTVVDSNVPRSKTKNKVTPRREERVIDTDVSQDEDLQQFTSKKRLTSKREPSLGQMNSLSKQQEVVAPVPATKIGPPRGVKRREMLRKSGSLGKRGPSHPKPREDHSTDERILTEGSKDQPENVVSPSGSALLTTQDIFDSPSQTSPLHTSVPPVISSTRARSPVLSPATIARLELFDRMMTDISPSDAPPQADVSVYVPGDTQDDYVAFDASEPPRPPSPPLPKSRTKRPKTGTPNGLVVPETESSATSQSQLQSLPKPSSPRPPLVHHQSPLGPLGLPTITFIAASVTSSSALPQGPLASPSRSPSPANRPLKRPTFKPMLQMTPNSFRSTIKVPSWIVEADAPPSSIESFTSPKHVDKGKQKAIESDGPHSSLSEDVDAGEIRERPAPRKITDLELKKLGKELFEQARLARQAERKKKKTAKRLKIVNEIVNEATVSSSPKGSPLPPADDAETTLAIQREEVADLAAGENSATLDAPEHNDVKPLSHKEIERLRIELREEEEESTQEAMDAYPLPPVKESELVGNGDVQMPPPRSPKSPFRGFVEDVEPIEQPSTDIQQASVIVQASQEQRYEDADTEPLPLDQPVSSLPRPIPETLTDSQKRRLGEALSLLNVKSEEIQRLEHELADAHTYLQDLRVELAEARQSSEPSAPVLAAWDAERAQWTQERSNWENDSSSWQAQRKEMNEEKASLLARVAELSDAALRAEATSAKLSELEAERVAWTAERGAMLNDLTRHLEELAAAAKLREEYDQDRAKWEAEKAQWIDEKTRWETERVALQEKQETLSGTVDKLAASVDSVTSTKASAEKDRDFFREQYMQASEFVSSVRQENIELENKAKIAEGQAQEGVAAIKTLFEGRVKALQADIDRWKGLAELLQEKDTRTNDELRLRAALVPELEHLCGRLTEEKQSLEAEARKLGRAQQRNVTLRNRLFYQILVLKKERASLQSKLSQLAKMAETSSAEQTSQPTPMPPPPVFEDPEGIDPNDMGVLPDPMSQLLDVDFDESVLFPCMWRPKWRDQCQHIFDTKEDLERHVQEHLGDLVI